MEDMIPIHCCCNPGKRLGYVPDMKLRVQLYDIDGETIELERGQVSTGIEIFLGGGFPALKSNDYPIEKLAKIPGFVPEVP